MAKNQKPAEIDPVEGDEIEAAPVVEKTKAQVRAEFYEQREAELAAEAETEAE